MERLVENRERKRHRSHILEAPLIWAVCYLVRSWNDSQGQLQRCAPNAD